jgi:hypothetical protein
MVQIQTKIFSTKNESAISDVLGGISNEYILDGNSIFRRIKAPTCNICGAQMVHNGFNTYSKKYLGSIRIGKYKCQKCQSNQEESKPFWFNLLSQIKDYFTSLALTCRNQNVSYEGIAEISRFIIPHGKDYFAELCADFLSKIDIPLLEINGEMPILHYDEQHPKKGRIQKYRLTLLDGETKRPIIEEIVDSKDNETIKDFISVIYDETICPFIVTDLDRRYNGIFQEIFGRKFVHQKCLFHQNKLVVGEFPKNCTIYQELVKYKFLNIFYNRTVEISFLENLLEEQEFRLKNNLPVNTDWKKDKRREFRNFLRDMENLRRRKHENLPLNSLEETMDNITKFRVFLDTVEEEKINNKLLIKLNKRFLQILGDFEHLTAFHHFPGTPATNNAVENYYSTTLKTNLKKQLRTDKGIINRLTLAALKRAGVLGEPPITLSEIMLNFKVISPIN